ncbi:prephenate dehydrogenase/arogenate dehydrogenase family protein [Streptantibioticus parmotrematis]|uniref:prephenate dehydrogenase/arogenate dehydrogenase family protein n=1 Tax=Streptantibioticus parmotrematis TaxID=2873249 RepID=UPI0033F6AC63
MPPVRTRPTGTGASSARPCLVVRSAAVVGTGPVGTSVALALTAAGVRVHLLDDDRARAEAARALGAGTLDAPDAPVDLAVIAVPASGLGRTVRACQRRGLARHYLDVAGVRGGRSVDLVGCDTGRWVGSRPPAAGGASGTPEARADLFRERPWVLTPLPGCGVETLNAALDAVTACGATPVVMDPGEHESAVALVSHVPHLLSCLLAARLTAAAPGPLRLAGPETEVMTRLAGDDPDHWADVLTANATAVADLLDGLADDLAAAATALRAAGGHPLHDPGAAHLLRDLLARGRAGRDLLDGGGTPLAARRPDARAVPGAGQAGMSSAG